MLRVKRVEKAVMRSRGQLAVVCPNTRAVVAFRSPRGADGSGQVNHFGARCVRLDRFDALVRCCLRFVCLADGDHSESL